MKKLTASHYSLTIHSLIPLETNLLNYLQIHFQSLVADVSKFLNFLKENFSSFYLQVFPDYIHRFNTWHIKDASIEIKIYKAIKINSIESKRFVYDLSFEITLNEIKIPDSILNEICSELLEDFNDGYYLEYNTNGKMLARIIEI